MNSDSHLIFEAYKTVINESMPYPEFAKLSKHAASKLPEDKSKEKLTFTYEVATAYLPRDIDVSTREGQDKVLSLAYDELVKAFTGKYENPKLAARNTFDEDFPMEIISQYKHYQKHGFPGEKSKGEYEFREQMPDSREEYSAHDYAKEMEAKGEGEESPGDAKRRKDNESRWMSILMNHFGKEYRRGGADPYLEFFERYSPYYEDWVIKKFAEMYNKTWASAPESKIDIDHFIKVKNELRDKKDADDRKFQASNENEERRLDPKCWKGYHKQGTKLKNGKRVNNCVKNS